MDFPIAAVVTACALFAVGCGNNVEACNGAKLRAASSWRTQELLGQAAVLNGEANNPRCTEAAHLAAEAAAKSPVEARRASEAALLSCNQAELAKSDAERAWQLCSKVEH